MTDKHIIIDGVDVSGCIYFKMNNKMPMCRVCNSGVGSPYCEYRKDCYYGQLARKTQECEILQQLENEEKEIIAELKTEKAKLEAQIREDTQYYIEEECNLRNIIRNKEKRNIELYKENNQLKEDNEELKKQLQAQHAFTRHEQKLIYCVAYDETCKTGNDCKQEKCIFKDNIKLKQTLTEIKEYLIKECKICKEQCAITNEDCADCQAQEILQKISEVE